MCAFVFKNKFKKIYNLNGSEIATPEDNKELTPEKSQESEIRLDGKYMSNGMDEQLNNIL